MADEVPESVDLWDVLEEAEQTVERWPPWQQRYEADIYYEDDDVEQTLLSAPRVDRSVCSTFVH